MPLVHRFGKASNPITTNVSPSTFSLSFFSFLCLEQELFTNASRKCDDWASVTLKQRHCSVCNLSDYVIILLISKNVFLSFKHG
jgi:hypothetical protein